MVRIASVERIEPRRVPSRRSRGTLRYMSREARRIGAMVDVAWRGRAVAELCRFGV